MHRTLLLLALALLWAVPAQAAREAGGAGPVVAVLCYHDLTDDPAAPAYSLPADSLRAHLRRARSAGWTIVPLSRVLAAARRPGKLPRRALVLTFDDGYRSFAEHALPVLRAERAPATLSVVSSWVDRPPPGLPPLLTWAEIRELDRDPLVEVISHGHDLHRYLTSNPYGDTAPAVTARAYVTAESRYETRSEHEARLADDLRQAQHRLGQALGRKVRVLAWPYGEHSAAARRLAAEAGFEVTLGLEGGPVRADSLAAGCVPRIMVYGGDPIAAADSAWLDLPPRPVRAVEVDLDDLDDSDPEVRDGRIAEVTERLRALGATHVILQTLADPAGDGFLREAWFMNHQLPVRADLWSMAAHRLARAGVQVWARAPALNLSWAWAEHPEWRLGAPAGRAAPERVPRYFRVSPDLEAVQEAAVDFYTDLAVYLPVRGVLFDDDAFLAPEDSLRGGTSGARPRAAALRGLLARLRAAVRAWRPQCRFARALYPQALEGGEGAWAQDAAAVLRDGDLALVRAAPPADRPPAELERWADSLGRAAAQVLRSAPPGSAMLLEFQAGPALPGATLEAMVRRAERSGLRDLGLARVRTVQTGLPEALLRVTPAAAPPPAAGRAISHSP